MKKLISIVLLCLLALPAYAVRIKELARVAGVREQPLIGYGIVVGLAGSGDSSRSAATLRSLANTLSHFGVQLPPGSLASRNVAAVMVTASLPAFAEQGQALDVAVASVADARSIAGGTLLLTPLYGPDERLYALAQGALSVGGYQYETQFNLRQKNTPTAGRIPSGATVEAAPGDSGPAQVAALSLLLHEADFTTAERIARAINGAPGGARALATHAGRVDVQFGRVRPWVAAVAALEALEVEPDQRARVVINERTGTLVAGADVRIAPVAVSHGDLRVEVDTRFSGYGGNGVYVGEVASGDPLLVQNTTLEAHEQSAGVVATAEATPVAELVAALQALKVSTRDLIAILQAIKQAGALHADLIIQ